MTRTKEQNKIYYRKWREENREKWRKYKREYMRKKRAGLPTRIDKKVLKKRGYKRKFTEEQIRERNILLARYFG